MGLSAPVIFTHIPKTAGGSIHHSIQVQFGLEAVHIVTGRQALSELRTLAAAGRAFTYIGGHLTARDANEIYQTPKLIAALRNPLDRLLSHFFYMLRYGHIKPEDTSPGGLVEAFEGFYSRLSAAGGTNALCRYLSGADESRAAIEAAKESYHIVWNAERTPEAWPRIYRLCARTAGMAPNPEPVPMAPIHIADVSSEASELAKGSRPSSYRTFLPAELSERVLAENAEDLRLIDWLGAEHNGLFDRSDTGGR